MNRERDLLREKEKHHYDAANELEYHIKNHLNPVARDESNKNAKFEEMLNAENEDLDQQI